MYSGLTSQLTYELTFFYIQRPTLLEPDLDGTLIPIGSGSVGSEDPRSGKDYRMPLL